jgi:hypothetical protein
MFGLDEQIAAFSNGTTLVLVALTAAVLGLRHATDPDHLAAVSTYAAGGGRSARRPHHLGLAWGAGHATTLIAFGVPVILAHAYIPDAVQRTAEVAVGVLIMALALRLLVQWRRRELHATHHPHGTGGRSLRTAFGIGLVHGIGGSAGVGVLLLAAIPDHLTAMIALGVFAAGSALSMGLVSAGVGAALTRSLPGARAASLTPALGACSLAFGAWYALGALEAVPYVL